MPLGVEIHGWYVVAVAAAGGYLLWASVLDTGHRHDRWIKGRFRPDPPTPPAITVGDFGSSYSILPIDERPDSVAYLTMMKPHYLIENKETSVTVENVTTGMRRKDDGRDHVFAGHRIHQFAPSDSPSTVHGMELPVSLLEGLTEQTCKDVLVVWARFTDRANGVRWEVSFDPATKGQPTYGVIEDDPTL